MPVEVVRLADSSMSLKAQPIDMPHGGWCKPPARPVVMIVKMKWISVPSGKRANPGLWRGKSPPCGKLGFFTHRQAQMKLPDSSNLPIFSLKSTLLLTNSSFYDKIITRHFSPFGEENSICDLSERFRHFEKTKPSQRQVRRKEWPYL